MVYFLRPSYSFSRPSYSFDPTDRNNWMPAVISAVVAIVVVVLYVFFQRPTAMGLCDKNSKDEKGKCKVNWGTTSGVAIGAGVLVAAIVMGGLYAKEKSAANAAAAPAAAPASPAVESAPASPSV